MTASTQTQSVLNLGLASFVFAMHPVFACTVEVDDSVVQPMFSGELKSLFFFVLMPTLLAWMITIILKITLIKFRSYSFSPLIFAGIFVFLMLLFFVLTVIAAPILIGCMAA